MKKIIIPVPDIGELWKKNRQRFSKKLGTISQKLGKWRFVFVGMGIAYFAFSLISNSEGRRYAAQRLYIERYKDIAVKEARRTGVLPSITLAQGALESRNGKSKLAKKYNNHFGIKCHGYGKCTKMGAFCDDDCQDQFRIYESPWLSFIDHSNFLMQDNKRRYGFMLAFGRDYEKWAHGLQKAGYATGKTYANKLIKIIERHRLFELDVEDYYAFDYEVEEEAKAVLTASTSEKEDKKKTASSSSSRSKSSSKSSSKSKSSNKSSAKSSSSKSSKKSSSKKTSSKKSDSKLASTKEIKQTKKTTSVKEKPAPKERTYSIQEKNRIALQEKQIADLEQQLVEVNAKIDVYLESSRLDFPPEYWELDRRRTQIKNDIVFNKAVLKAVRQ